MKPEVKDYCDNYMQFLETAVCAPWTAKGVIEHATKYGFKIIEEKQVKFKGGDKFIFNNSYNSVALVRVGEECPAKKGFNVIACHIDNPQLILKPKPIDSKEHCFLLKTMFHGGGGWTTWFNRPLGIAGRYYERSSGRPNIGEFSRLPEPKEKFIRIDDIPSVIAVEAKHLNANVDSSRKLDEELDLHALIAIENETEKFDEYVQNSLEKRGISLKDCSRAEFYLYPLEKPQYIGLEQSMIFAHGHDDRSMVFAALSAICEAEDTAKTSIVFFFDNEEIGSQDRGGATSRWSNSVARRITEHHERNYDQSVDDLEIAWAKSVVLSADVGHACIPPHGHLFDLTNAAYMGKGPSIAIDEDGNYATSAQGIAIIQDLASRHDIPLQIETNKQNKICGTTIGPMIAANMGAMTVDIGVPILSMHSCMEIGSTSDFYNCKELFVHYFNGD